MGGTQFIGATAHAAGYLVVADIAHAFLLKKRELLQKALIVFSVLMIWLTSTNYFANQFTQMAGYFLEWPQPLKLEKGLIKNLNPNHLKASSPTDAYQLKSKYLDASSYTQKLRSKEVSSEASTQAIVILGSGLKKGALDLPEYQYQNLSPQSMERLRAGARLAKRVICLSCSLEELQIEKMPKICQRPWS
jgi:hypothetical protein